MTTRVVHITTVAESLGFLRGQAAFMKQAGFELAAISSPGELLDRFAADQQIEVSAVEMIREITPLRDLAALYRLWRELRRLRPTIVHAHTPKGGLLGTLAARLAGVPVRVYHLRGLPLLTATGRRRSLLRWTERVTCFAADEVIAVSHSLRDAAIAERLVAREKIKVLAGGSGNGVDAGRFDPSRVGAEARASTRARYRIPAEALVIGFVGRLVRDKGVLELLEAWRVISRQRLDAHLLVVGMLERRDAIPDDTVAALREDPRIHWIGEHWETPPLYAAMDVVALPTYREGFPNVPLEAAAMSLPIVATRVAGCTDAIVDGETGTLVAPRDGAALAAALLAYLEAPALRRTHGEAARRHVTRLFRPEVIWQALLVEYERLVAEHAR